MGSPGGVVAWRFAKSCGMICADCAVREIAAACRCPLSAVGCRQAADSR